jgi:hypothetical protein
MFGKLTAIAGFSFIVAPALLAENDLLDNTTFTVLFIIGFLLVLVSFSTRNRSPTTLEQIG